MYDIYVYIFGNRKCFFVSATLPLSGWSWSSSSHWGSGDSMRVSNSICKWKTQLWFISWFVHRSAILVQEVPNPNDVVLGGPVTSEFLVATGDLPAWLLFWVEESDIHEEKLPFCILGCSQQDLKNHDKRDLYKWRYDQLAALEEGSS